MVFLFAVFILSPAYNYIELLILVIYGNLETIVARILEELQNFFPEFLDAFDVQIVLDDGTLVAELTPKIDQELGAIRKRKERG